jgi:hypothetical protein
VKQQTDSKPLKQAARRRRRGSDSAGIGADRTSFITNCSFAGPCSLSYGPLSLLVGGAVTAGGSRR